MRERKPVYRKSRRLLVSLVVFFMCCAPLRIHAQTSLTLRVVPPVEDETMYIPSEMSDGIHIYAEISGKWKQLNWTFSGPGRFQNTELGGAYQPPEELEESPTYVVLTATLITTKGRHIREALKWTLMDPPSTPTPFPTPTPMLTPNPTSTPTMTPTATPRLTATASPTPSPTATPTATPTPTPVLTATPTPTPVLTATPTASPSPTPTSTPKPTVAPNAVPDRGPDAEATSVPSLSELETHLRAAQRYFEKKAYTTPQGENAFDEYKFVLTLDPTNRQARKGIYNILRKYKFWGDDEYKKGRLEKARQAYRRYLIVAEYLLETFDDGKLEQAVQTVQKKLQ